MRSAHAAMLLHQLGYTTWKAQASRTEWCRQDIHACPAPPGCAVQSMPFVSSPQHVLPSATSTLVQLCHAGGRQQTLTMQVCTARPNQRTWRCHQRLDPRKVSVALKAAGDPSQGQSVGHRHPFHLWVHWVWKLCVHSMQAVVGQRALARNSCMPRQQECQSASCIGCVVAAQQGLAGVPVSYSHGLMLDADPVQTLCRE